MHYRVTHTTTYAYEELVSICHNEMRLEPRSAPRQRCLATALAIEPTPAVLGSSLDYFGNRASFFTLQEPHHRMVVTARSELEVSSVRPVRPSATPAWEELREQIRTQTTHEALSACEMSFESPLVPALPAFARYAAPSFSAGRPMLDAVLDLTHRIHADYEYRPGATSVTTPVEEVLARRHGVCQDFAHLELACLRALGLPARYVSGYLHTRRARRDEAKEEEAEREEPAGEPTGEAALVGADASHAWVSVWCGDAGWIDVDPTNDLVTGDHHLTLAWGRDYADVAPIKGVILGGGEHTVEVAVDVEVVGD
ncbi:MAG TPA: transglutaminase family protein [Myxococcota bacterium]|nr:transglutaminase family protein [Myxococcota bacterium]